MKYVVCVKTPEDIENEVYEFTTEEARQDFIEEMKFQWKYGLEYATTEVED